MTPTITPDTAGVPKGYVLVPEELANRVQDSLGRFTSDEGWSQSDMSTADDFADLPKLQAAQPQAEQQGAGELFEALENLVRKGEAMRNTVVETRGLRGMDEHDEALMNAEKILAKARGEA